jgi:hypothetical protein
MLMSRPTTCDNYPDNIDTHIELALPAFNSIDPFIQRMSPSPAAFVQSTSASELFMRVESITSVAALGLMILGDRPSHYAHLGRKLAPRFCHVAVSSFSCEIRSTLIPASLAISLVAKETKSPIKINPVLY